MNPDENEPLPLCDPRSGDTAPLLRAALGAAREKLPTADDLASIAAGLPLGGPGGAGPAPGSAGPAPGSAGPAPGSAGPAPGSAGPAGAALGKVSVLPGILAGAALGVLVSALSLVVPAAPPGPGAPASPGAGPTAPLAAAEPAGTAPLPAPPSPLASASAEPGAPTAPVAPSEHAAAPLAPGAPGDTGPAAGAGATSPDANPGSTALAASAADGPPEAGAETEVDLLDRARRALASDASSALALTVQHAARFPRGALGQEREVVAIQALVQLGRSDEARARAERFLAAHPGSAHRPRIEAVLGR